MRLFSRTNFIHPRTTSKVLAVGLCASLAFSPLMGCHKSEQTGGSASAGGSTSRSASLGLESTLVTHLPDNTVGFLQWDNAHPAYKKLLASPWAGGQDMFKKAFDVPGGSDGLIPVLKKAGIDLTDRASVESIFSQGAVFTTPKQGAAPGSVGMLIKSASSVNLPEKLEKLKKEAATSGLAPQDLKVAHGSGFSFDIPTPTPVRQQAAAQDAAPPVEKNRMFIAWDKDLAVMSTEQAGLDAAWNKTDEKLPTVVQSADFKDSSAPFANSDSRFMFGYVDLATLVGSTQGELPPEVAAQMQAFDASKFPVKTITLAASMEDTPQTQIRISVVPSSDDQKVWISALKNSNSQQLVGVVPINPLAFLSLDGDTLRAYKNLAVEKSGMIDDSMKTQLAILDNIHRLGVFARMAPPGQSFLPFPDVALVAQSDKPEQTKTLAEQIAQQTLGESMGGAGWTESTVAGATVREMKNPLGYGIFIAQAKDLVIIASSSSAVANALSSLPKSEFVGSLSSPVVAALSEQKNVGNLYLNFEQIAGLMQSAKGMMGMFAPQAGPEANKFLNQEYIESVKKMGSMVGTVTFADKYLDIRSSYESAPNSAKKG